MDFKEEYLSFVREWHDAAGDVAVHTSGSTGTPKEILLAKGDMMASARSTCDRFGITPASYLHCPLAFSYIAAKMMYVRSLAAGCKLSCEVASSHPGRGEVYVGTLPSDGRISLLPIVPMQLEGFLQGPLANRTGNILIGGAPLSPRQEDEARRAPGHFFATYGMTETSSHVALRDISAGEKKFRALPGYIFSVDADGCLIISNPAMSWRELRTTDVVELLSPDSFIWKGRATSVINSGGIKVMPEEVESLARTLLPGILLCVCGREDERLGREVVLVIAPDSELPMPEEEVLSCLRRNLPQYHAPRAIVRHEIVRTHTGKIVRPTL